MTAVPARQGTGLPVLPWEDPPSYVFHGADTPAASSHHPAADVRARL